MYRYYMFNKPSGCVTARKDKDHKTVMDYFPEEMRETYHPVGRLDKNTKGLLIITNNGKLTHFLAEPKYHVTKKYFFMALGKLDSEKIKKLEEGIYLKGSSVITKPAKVEVTEVDILENREDMLAEEDRAGYMKNPKCPVVLGNICITEGRNHQVRRMMKSVGCHVVYLKRTAMGELTLDSRLEEGRFREITPCEIKRLMPVNNREILKT